MSVQRRQVVAMDVGGCDEGCEGRDEDITIHQAYLYNYLRNDSYSE